LKTYSSYFGVGATPGDIQRVINNSAADNLTWGMEQINDANRYLISKYYFNERTYTVPGGTVGQTQFYNLPPQIKKLINLTITIGSVVWQPKECPTRQDWDALNVQVFYNDFPLYFFVYNGQVGIWPTPSSNGNVITMNYKTRITDLSQPDYSVGTVSVTTNTATITGSGTTWTKAMAENGWIRIAHSATDSANGDNQWYQISSVNSATSITLMNNYTGATVAAGTYTLGQVSILPEDYQDLPLYRMALIYYTTRFPDPTRAGFYQKLYDTGEEKLNEEYGSKTSSIILTDVPLPVMNPNLFQSNLTGH
jgi:hypothetical protein